MRTKNACVNGFGLDAAETMVRNTMQVGSQCLAAAQGQEGDLLQK